MSSNNAKVARTLYRALLRSVTTRQQHLELLRGPLKAPSRAIAELSELASAPLMAKIRGSSSFDDMSSTCRWTRYALHFHGSHPARACRARFDETAAELLLLADATGSQDFATDAKLLEKELTAMLGEAGMPEAVASMLSEMQTEPLTARLDTGLEGLRLLDELNSCVAEVVAELQKQQQQQQQHEEAPSAPEPADAGTSALLQGADGGVAGASSVQAETGAGGAARSPLTRFSGSTPDPYGKLGE
jgi:hypothetical protein